LDIGGSNEKRSGTKKEKRLGIHETLNVAAWIVRSIGNKESELVEQPSWKKGQHQTTETRPQLQTSRKKRSWTPH